MMDAHIGKEGSNDKVIRAYVTALVAHKRVYDYQSENYGLIRRCGLKFRLVSAPGVAIGLLLGVIASLVAAYIFRALPSQ